MHHHFCHRGHGRLHDDVRAYFMGRHGRRFGHFAGGFTGGMGMGGRAFRAGRRLASGTCSWCCWRSSAIGRATATN